MLKKTKVVCTMGPNVDKDAQVLVDMIKNGMNVARFNFSHGDHAEHEQRINLVKETAKKLGITISLMLDTKGPEMRLGEFANGKVMLKKGTNFTLTNEETPGDETHASVSHKLLYTEVKPGDTLLLSDGLVALRVEEIIGKDIKTTVLNDGPMSTRKRVAAPGIALGLPAISEQDKNDIIFGIKHDMDFVAASFIQRASDVEEIRELIKEHNGRMEILPKIECAAGVQNIDSIIEASDGIMVARGDLGIEIPAEDVPLIQKEIIKKCNKVGKPVIVATQMLESMTSNPRPTRAEASDVANAIFDGTDAIMLSGESANGDYPVEAVKVMDSIARRVEKSLEYKNIFLEKGLEHRSVTTDVIAHATVQMAYELGATAIITPTESGYTAKVVSKYRPKAAIIAYTSSEKAARQLNLRWGVVPMIGEYWNDVHEMISASMQSAHEKKIIRKGEKIIITSGMKFAEGDTSAIRVRTV